MVEDDRREHLRYDPDKNSLVVLYMDSQGEDTLVGLLRDESHSGCGAVFHQEYFPFSEGDEVKIKPGKLSPKKASIAWVQSVDEKLVRAGFKYEDR